MTTKEFIEWLETRLSDDVIDLYEAGYDEREITAILSTEYELPDHMLEYLYDFVLEVIEAYEEAQEV